jgi:carboxymethylenebutenolidase
MRTSDVALIGPRGRTTAQVFEPSSSGEARVGLALAVEATGMNAFGLSVVEQLVDRGMVVVATDYYRGGGPADPEVYDVPELVRCIGQLDFSAAITDQLAAIDHLRSRSDVDPERVVSWGYCTGGTLAWAAAALDRQLSCAVIYYPSQPSFASHDPQHPFDVLELLSTQTVPTLFIVGSDDNVLTEPVRQVIAQRNAEVGGIHQLLVLPGARHAFAGPMPGRHDADAAAAAWSAAIDWVDRHASTTSGAPVDR